MNFSLTNKDPLRVLLLSRNNQDAFTGGNAKFKWHFSNIKQALNPTKYLSCV